EGDDQHEWRRPVLDPADGVHATHDDEDVDRPENGEAQPEGPVLARNHRRVRPAATEQLAGEPVERAPADPGLDAEPATGHPGPKQGCDIGAKHAEGGSREYRGRDAVFGAGVT